jgi:hypothetical protein
VTQFDPGFMNGRTRARDLAFVDLGLYWEHDWTGDGPVPRQARMDWQRRIAAEIATYVDTLHADAAAALAQHIRTAGASTRFYAFNPLSWPRDDYADMSWTDPAPVHVVEVGSGIEVPSQRVTVDGQAYLRIWATGVPPVGYKVYEVQAGAGQTFEPAATVTTGGGAGTTAVTYTIAADDRDATSVDAGGAAHEVRVSGYNAGDRRDYVSSDSEQESAALEFALDVPAGVVVQEAYLTVRAGPYSNASPTGGMLVRSYDVADAAPFVNGPYGDLLTHHPVTAVSVTWGAPDWVAGADVNSPNLQPLVQAFVNRADYQPGHHLGFVITAGTLATDRYYGWEDFASGVAPARLTVTYVVPGRSSDLVLENARYRLTVTPRGAVSSLLDKAQGSREFAAVVNGRMLNDLGASAGSVEVEQAGPVSVTLRATAPQPLQHTSRITLFRGGERIDLRNEITQNFGSTYLWGFGFALASPQTRFEEVGAIARARLTTAGGDYAPRQARYDWLTLNHFADMSGADGPGLTLANADCYYFRLGSSSETNLDTLTPAIWPLVGGLVDGGSLGMPNQGGDTHFLQRFALRTHAGYSPTAAMKFALEQQNPLVCQLVSGTTPHLPAGQFAGVNTTDGNVLLWALKPAEEGPTAGTIARLWNVGESAATTTLQLTPRPIVAAQRTTHLETDEGAIPVGGSGLTAAFGRQEIRTFRLTLGLRGDVNCDGDVDFGDINPFVMALTNPAAYDAAYPGCPLANRDINGDGLVDFGDINPFVTVLTN